jgi:hypothetical protein
LPSSQTPSESAAQKSGQPSVIEFGGLRSSERDESVEFNDVDTAKDVAPDRETLSYTVEAPVSQSASLTASGPIRRQPTPPIDEPSALISSSSQRRPRTHDDCVPIAADPFADQFEEEEIVLDGFLAISQIFHAGTPRVDNLRDRTFADRVEAALAESTTRPEARNQEIQASTSSAAQSSDQPKSRARLVERQQDSIRLAVIGEAESLEANKSPRSRSAYPRETMLPATKRPRQIEESILVIDDEPAPTARPEPGARREAYRDLFSRLRHGS